MDFRLLLWAKHWSLWREHSVFVKPKLSEGPHAKMLNTFAASVCPNTCSQQPADFIDTSTHLPSFPEKHYASIRFCSCFDFREPHKKAVFFGWKPETEQDDNKCMKSKISCCVEIPGYPYSTSLSQKFFISKCGFFFVGLQKYFAF